MSLSSITQILHQIQSQPGWEQVRNWQQIVTAWREVVSTEIASQTQPRSVYRGMLNISTASSSLAHQLTFQRRLLCRQLNALLPPSITPVRDLRFSPSGWSRSLTPSTQPNADSDLPRVEGRSILNCPDCDLRTPSAELQRWGVCRFCAIDRGIIG